MKSTAFPTEKDDWFRELVGPDAGSPGGFPHGVAVLRDRAAFLSALYGQLHSYRGVFPDSVAQLEARIDLLDDTLSLRLGSLPPNIKSPWFREYSAVFLGPTGKKVMQEPIFGAFPDHEIPKIKLELGRSWQQRDMISQVWDTGKPTLWSTLLKLNHCYETIAKLPVPFPELRLDQLPVGLATDLHSHSLLRYLKQLKARMLHSRGLLDDMYDRLWCSCEGFWQYRQASAFRRHGSGNTYKNRHGPGASSGQRDTGANPLIAEALQVMRFQAVPTTDELKRRYRELARQTHPDTARGSEEQFRHVVAAYQMILKTLEP